MSETVTVEIPIDLARCFVHAVATYRNGIEQSIDPVEADATSVAEVMHLISAAIPGRKSSKAYYRLLDVALKTRREKNEE